MEKEGVDSEEDLEVEKEVVDSEADLVEDLGAEGWVADSEVEKEVEEKGEHLVKEKVLDLEVADSVVVVVLQVVNDRLMGLANTVSMSKKYL